MLRHVSQRGGMGNYTRQLMAAMLGSDRANEYVMYYSPTERLGRYVGANVIERVVRARSKLWWDQWAIPRQAARDRVDLIFNPKLSVPLRSPVPGVFVLHGPEHFVVPSAYDPVDRLQAHTLMPRYVRSAAAVILSTEDAKAMTCKLIANAPEKIHVIRPAVDARFTKAVTDDQITATRAKYGLPDRFMLFVGGLHRIKNFGRIAEALAALRSHLGDATPPLVAAGFVTASYPERGRSRWGVDRELAKIDELGVRDLVHFPGYVEDDDLPALYRLAELLLFPSLYEGFGLPVLEAQACGCPVVTSARGGTREASGGAALLVDPYDTEAITGAILELLFNRATRQRLISAGHANTAGWRWEDTAAAVIALFEDVVRRGGRLRRQTSAATSLRLPMAASLILATARALP
jgi:glycosyltransferase involved in cell wall biosynthesis